MALKSWQGSIAALLDVVLELIGKREELKVVDADALADDEPTEVLERPDLGEPRDWLGEADGERGVPRAPRLRVADDGGLREIHRRVDQLLNESETTLVVETEEASRVTDACMEGHAWTPEMEILLGFADISETISQAAPFSSFRPIV